MPLRNYINTALPVTLSVGVNASATSFQVPSTAGYPTAPFTLGIERGTANEEMSLCTGIPDSTHFTVTRGYDGTSGKSHSPGIAIEHCVSAGDYSDANSHIFDTTRNDHTQYLLRNILTTKGDIFASAAGGIVRVAVGSDGTVLTADSTQAPGLRWGTISLVPSGTIAGFAGSAAPSGWLLCDGSTVNRVTYAALFTAIGTGFNTGGEAGTDFRLPDARGRVLMGAGSGAGLTARALAARLGEEAHQQTVNELVSHNHTQSAHTHTISIAGPFASVFSGLNITNNVNNVFLGAYVDAQQPAIQFTGGNVPFNVIQPSLVANVIIKI